MQTIDERAGEPVRGAHSQHQRTARLLNEIVMVLALWP